MCCHPAEYRRHGAHGSPFCVIHRSIVAYGCKELIMLQLVGILTITSAMAPDGFACLILDAFPYISRTLGALEISPPFIEGSQHRSDLAVQLGTISIFIFDKEMIKNVSVIGTAKRGSSP